jgi:hypothetical protein
MTPQPTQRTINQNNALHKYLELVAEALDREGHTMQDVVKAIRRAEIRPTKEALKEVVWKPLQEIILSKKSTTELTKHEIDPVYEAMNKWLGQEFHIHIPFPNRELPDLAGNSADFPIMR